MSNKKIVKNREAFSNVTFTPKFMQGRFEPDTSTTLFGTQYALPFGVAPVGLTGLMWPEAEKILARAAGQYRIPYSLSTVATEVAAEMGLDGIVVSNHGARQCDGLAAPLDVLTAIKKAAGDDMSVIYDSGVRTGLDIIRALAMGADFVMMGRPFMYGVAALGEAGGAHAIEILRDDLKEQYDPIRLCSNR